MTRLPVPLNNLRRRIPEAGRLRMGVKTGRAMKAIDTWRFTSHDKVALEQIADLYGGAVKAWSDPKAAEGQFEVITDASEIRIVLPPEPLSGPVYELWSGGGCERRCDGEHCETMQRGPEGPEPVEVPCLCSAAGALSCDVKTRLSVLLPEIRFAGVWRLDTKSWNAAQELPGMVELVQSQQGNGLSYAVLAIKPRRTVTNGQTKRFLVPQLGIPQSLEELAAGMTRLGALPATEAPALEAGEPDDVVVDAEIVDSPDPQGCSLCGEVLGDEPLVKGTPGDSKWVHKACREAFEEVEV